MTKKTLILDACCGGRAWWHNKHHPAAVYMDVRQDSILLCDGRTVDIAPDIVADFRAMPFHDGYFQAVLFDPPHLLRAGQKSWLRARYGVLSRDTWQNDLRQGFSECFRVLKNGGSLLFKWNETQIPLSHVLPLAAPYAPLVTHSRNKTHFAFFLKIYPPNHERKKLLRYSLTAETQEQLCHFCHETACDALQELGLEHTLKLAHAVLFAYFTLGVLASLPGGDLTEQAKHNIKLLQELLNCAEIELESTYHITKSEQ